MKEKVNLGKALKRLAKSNDEVKQVIKKIKKHFKKDKWHLDYILMKRGNEHDFVNALYLNNFEVYYNKKYASLYIRKKRGN